MRAQRRKLAPALSRMIRQQWIGDIMFERMMEAVPSIVVIMAGAMLLTACQLDIGWSGSDAADTGRGATDVADAKTSAGDADIASPADVDMVAAETLDAKPDLCIPACEGKECGNDGCGGTCGECQPSYSCVDKKCLPETDPCAKACEGRECGDSGREGCFCGACYSPKVCSSDGQCICVPSCLGEVCGAADGCGGKCVEADMPCADDPGDPCLLTECKDDGECVYQGVPDGAPCDDGEDCTHFDTCLMGMCTGLFVPCEDHNDCTDNVCQNVDGQFCEFEAKPEGTPCDDGNECTEGACNEDGICVGEAFTEMQLAQKELTGCLCSDQVDCEAERGDENSCNGLLWCGTTDVQKDSTYVPKQKPYCVVDPATVSQPPGACWFKNAWKDCDDKNACTVDTWSEEAKECLHDTGDNLGAPCAGEPNFLCTAEGICECQPDCVGKVCGPDGCNGVCGPADGDCLDTDDLGCQVPVCKSGTCGVEIKPDQCLIDEKCYPKDSTEPGNPCHVCSPKVSQENWSIWPDGDPKDECGNGLVCFAGECCPATGNCSKKDCGYDGCGGECPPGCEQFETCNQVSGSCICSDLTKQCGEQCCGPNEECNDTQQCVCFDDKPKCSGTCCAQNQVCNPATQKCCAPDCLGKECGSDGCGGVCQSTCTPGQYCDEATFKCKPFCGDGNCEANKSESCTNCPADCGLCCGNGLCDNGETKCTCIDDCGDPCEGFECGLNECNVSCGSCIGFSTGKECTKYECNETEKKCNNAVIVDGWCLIKGECYEDGDKHSENPCKICSPSCDAQNPECNPQEANKQWSNVANGEQSTCPDQHVCHDGTCCNCSLVCGQGHCGGFCECPEGWTCDAQAGKCVAQ